MKTKPDIFKLIEYTEDWQPVNSVTLTAQSLAEAKNEALKHIHKIADVHVIEMNGTDVCWYEDEFGWCC